MCFCHKGSKWKPPYANNVLIKVPNQFGSKIPRIAIKALNTKKCFNSRGGILFSVSELPEPVGKEQTKTSISILLSGKVPLRLKTLNQKALISDISEKYFQRHTGAAF